MRTYEINQIALDNDSLKLGETLFHNANGYIGVRGCFEEGYPEGFDSVRGMYINGFYDFASMPQAEKLCGLIEEKQTMLNVADTQGIEVFINGERFSMFEGTVLESKRVLDMEKGVTRREILWKSPAGKTVKIEVQRMASFAYLPLFLVEYTVSSVDFQGEVVLRSNQNGKVMNYCDPNDPRVAGESVQYIFPETPEILEGISLIASTTAKSGLSMCSAVRNCCSMEDVSSWEIGEAQVTEVFTGALQVGQSLHLTKYTVLCDSIRYPNVKEAALETMREVLALPVEELHRMQEAYLAKIWEDCSIAVDGDAQLDEAITYNLYQLIQSAGKDPHCNIAAKGLSGEGYEGHYFWDTEMYMQPFFVLNAREISKNLIRNRYSILDYAKENARLLGHKQGAAFPWRTIMGKECSGYYPSGSAAYHISGDISYSVIAYYLATKDLELMQECGAEILLETARMWMDLGTWHEGQFMIHTVTGPDEYTCLVNNNYYTNVLAQYNLKWAVKSLRLLEEAGMADALKAKTGITEEELASFQKAADKMYLPYDEKLDINPQDDSFLQKKVWDVSTITEAEKPLLLHYHPMYLYRFQVCKQADTVMAHFILEDAQKLSTIGNSFAYYEKVTTHDSSLSTCIFSIIAAKLGLVEKAYDYFGESAKLDLFNTHKNTKDGIHTANMGGTYMAIVYGFGGLRIKEDGLHLMPQLPKAWNGYRFRFLYEDARIEVQVQKDGYTVRLLEGSAKEIWLGDRKQVLDSEIAVGF